MIFAWGQDRYRSCSPSYRRCSEAIGWCTVAASLGTMRLRMLLALFDVLAHVAARPLAASPRLVAQTGRSAPCVSIS